jgi:hypothetical protein
MVFEDHSCFICMHPIKHPVCERCHIKEIAVWMEDREMTIEIRENVFYQIRKKLLFERPYKGYCISCYEELPNICSYCFFNKVVRILSDEGGSEDDLKSFLTTFNYKPLDEEYVLVG